MKQTWGLHLYVLNHCVRDGVHFSGASRYPFAIEIIGWISIIAAMFLSIIGRDNFKRLMSWALSLKKPFGRVGGFIAVCLGAFLVYAFV